MEKRTQRFAQYMIPVIRVGITPVLQMIFIPLITTALCRWLVNASAIAGQRK